MAQPRNAPFSLALATVISSQSSVFAPMVCDYFSLPTQYVIFSLEVIWQCHHFIDRTFPINCIHACNISCEMTGRF